jgi:hypothetical protein
MPDHKIGIRAYHLGRGECFLVQFKDKKRRNILIDFGAPSNHPLSELSAVAKDVADLSDGKLDTVIITHDHVDRISGFLSQKQIFDSIKVGEVWINGMCEVDEEDEVSESLQSCRNLVKPFREVLAETKTKVDKAFKYRLENNCPVEAQLDYVSDMVKDNKFRFLERTGDTADIKLSRKAGLNVHSPLGGLGNYDDVWRQNQITNINTRLQSRLENDPDEPAYTHPMFGDSFNRCQKPSHVSDSDFRTLRRKNFILGMSEYDLVEKAIDNSALVFTLDIDGKKLLFAGDITEANWYWMNYCYSCCELEDVNPDCPDCKEVQTQWADIDFCKVTSHMLDYEHENEILDLLPATSQLLLSKHETGATDKLIREAREKHGSNLTVINSTPNQLWSDIYL